MSIDAKLDEVIAALTANTEIMTRHNALLTSIAEKTGGAPATGASTSTTKAPTAAEKKAAEKAAKEAAEKEKGSATTAEAFMEQAGGWLNEQKPKTPEFTARAEILKKLAVNFGVERISLIPADKLGEAMGFLTQIKAGEDPFAEEPDEGSSVL